MVKMMVVVGLIGVINKFKKLICQIGSKDYSNKYVFKIVAHTASKTNLSTITFNNQLTV